ncbi:hypothetical protein HNR46_000767 [Haloferula luteola]|uniref:HupE / UreJ protein n=1 Tax=Haloferula luteola TaxID=595692 RepID=A0A840V9T1_9BACT|nr:HupE/UreJ family protein [Haloferula luteola]MBB5350539.1 hypothetical protein [Haloferula luteola]
MKTILLLLLALVGMACGHNMPGSSVALDFQPNSVNAELILPLQELELAFKRPLLKEPKSAFTLHEAELHSYLVEHVRPVSSDGRDWNVEVMEMHLQLDTEPFDLVATLHLTPPPGESARHFRFHYSVINHEVMSHFATVTVRSDWNQSVFSDHPEPLGMLQYTVTYLDVDRSQGSWLQGCRTVFRHGMHHISEGTDHLLFLLVLLLPAPLLATGKRWRGHRGTKPTIAGLLKIITAFTLGHSLTLIVAGLGWVNLPSQPVEVLIALSILVSAVHAVRPLFAGREAWVAAGFGLVHGLAFASTLEIYGFSRGYLLLTIVAFNLGIEAMQLMVVACVIPWIVILGRTKAYTWLRQSAAFFAAAAAIGWIGDRSFGWGNPIEPVVASVSSHAGWIVAALALAAITVLLRSGPTQRAAATD